MKSSLLWGWANVTKLLNHQSELLLARSGAPGGFEPPTNGLRGPKKSVFTSTDLSPELLGPTWPSKYGFLVLPPQNVAMASLKDVIRKAVLDAVASVSSEEPKRKSAARLEGELKIVWNEKVKQRLIQFMKTKRKPAGDAHIKNCISYLDRYMPPEGISTPEQVFDMFMRCTRGRHHLDRAFRCLLGLYRRVFGFDREFIERLKEAIPSTKTGEDKWVPPEELVVESLVMLKERNLRFFAVWNAVLDSAVRPMHIAEGLFENFNPSRLEKTPEGFYKYKLNIERGTKHAWVAYLTPYTAKLIMELYEQGERVTRFGVENITRRFKMVRGHRPDGKPIVMPLRLKYIRKFAMNMMRKNGLDKDVVQFLAGEKPKGIDEKHYLDLEMLADSQYPRYVAYLEKLRARAGL